jgi:hypothetical protein
MSPRGDSPIGRHASGLSSRGLEHLPETLFPILPSTLQAESEAFPLHAAIASGGGPRWTPPPPGPVIFGASSAANTDPIPKTKNTGNPKSFMQCIIFGTFLLG